MNKTLFRIVLIACISIGLVDVANAEGRPTEVVKAQAAKSDFIFQVGKIGNMAGNMFLIDTYAVMRMTHTNWHFPEDKQYLEGTNLTYAWNIRSTAKKSVYDGVQVEKAIARNVVVGDDEKERALEMIGLLQRMQELSIALGDLYDAGDVSAAGDFYYTEIVPVYEAIRRNQVTLQGPIAREIKLDALRFKE